jgi:hypothetical protein
LKLIDHADVAYPSALCRNGIEIIDTPGINNLDLSMKRSHTASSQADAIIFVLSAKMFLAQTELEFFSQQNPQGGHPEDVLRHQLRGPPAFRIRSSETD